MSQRLVVLLVLLAVPHAQAACAAVNSAGFYDGGFKACCLDPSGTCIASTSGVVITPDDCESVREGTWCPPFPTCGDVNGDAVYHVNGDGDLSLHRFPCQAFSRQGWRDKAGAENLPCVGATCNTTKDSNDLAICCELEATCGDVNGDGVYGDRFPCPAEYVPKAGAKQFCAGPTCDTTSAADLATCCEAQATCSSLSDADCPAGYVPKAGAKNDTCAGASCNTTDTDSVDVPTCCQATCSAASCPIGYFINASAKNDTCAGAACDTDSATGVDVPTCCQATCSTMSCPIGYFLKASAENELCAGKTCDTKDSDDITTCCEAQATCCDGDGSCEDGDDDYCCGGEYYCSNDGAAWAKSMGGILCPGGSDMPPMCPKFTLADCVRVNFGPCSAGCLFSDDPKFTCTTATGSGYRPGPDGKGVDTTTRDGCEGQGGFYCPDWLIPLLIGLAAVVILTIAVTVKFANNEPEPEPTFWDKVKCTVADLTNTNCDKFQLFGGRRDESATMTARTGNAEAYQIAQVLSTTSASTVTSMVVSRLQAANYTGPMPTMITTVITSVTDGASSSDGSGSNTTLVAVAIVVAAVLVLIAVLVVGALVYMYKMNKKEQAPAAGQAAAPPTMGAVGLTMNPMHSTVDSKEGVENI